MKKVKCCQVSHKFSFVSMISLTATFFLVEIVVGYVTNSMALVADSFHMLSDVVSLLVGYAALRLSLVRQSSTLYTFGWARAEVIGALVNAVFLIALCFSILVEALKRLVLPEHLGDAHLVLITGGIGLLVNIIGLFLFHEHGHSHSHGHSHTHGHSHSHGHSHNHGHSHGHSHGHPGSDDSEPNGHCPNHNEKQQYEEESVVVPILEKSKEVEGGDGTTTGLLSLKDHAFVGKDEQHDGVQGKTQVNMENTSSQLNMRAVYLHVLGDALGSVIVIVSALLVIYGKGDWTRYVDPALSIVMVLIILKTSFPLFKESAMILMQTVPDHIHIEELRKRLMQRIPGVLSVHEFHIWQLSGNKIIASVHVHCQTLSEYMVIANQLKKFFHQEGIHSTTIQPEYVDRTPPECTGGWERLNIDSCVLECNEVCSEGKCCRNSSMQESTENSSNDSVSSISQRSSKNEIESIESGFQTSEQLENGSDSSLSQGVMGNEEGSLELGSIKIVSSSVHSISEVAMKKNGSTDSNSSGYEGSLQEIDLVA